MYIWQLFPGGTVPLPPNHIHPRGQYIHLSSTPVNVLHPAVFINPSAGLNTNGLTSLNDRGAGRKHTSIAIDWVNTAVGSNKLTYRPGLEKRSSERSASIVTQRPATPNLNRRSNFTQCQYTRKWSELTGYVGIDLHSYIRSIGCPRVIRTLYFDVQEEGKSNFIFSLYSAAWST